MENTNQVDTSSSRTLIIFLWIASLMLVGFVSFLVGKNSNDVSQTISLVPNSTSSPTQPAGPKIPQSPTPVVDLETSCEKSGPSQKRDYLLSYLLKEGDSLKKIAEEQLQDATRVSEITKLNEDQRQLTVGSTIYLPPANIQQSSGSIFEVSGKIVKKDNASWQLTYGGGSTGPGIVFPGFWFKDIGSIETYKIGDCVTILFDNGVKVYSVKKS